MPGLYVHIPFCARRCPYCDFAVSVDRRPQFRVQYQEAMRRELQLALPPGAPVLLSTVFFGGGTPTELPASHLNELLSFVRDRSQIAPDAEITLEANPEHLSSDYLRTLHAGGWNRISLGGQSLSDADLQFLGRRHTVNQLRQAVEDARQAGFGNISLDLIYAVPGQTLASWENTLRQAVELGVQHLSPYSLTIEEGTEFGRRQRLGQLVPLDDDAQADFMAAAHSILEGAGYLRYEISNYALPGYQSRHNQNYWQGGDYLAAGAGAHGHKSGQRWWNERSATHYVKRMLSEGTAVAGQESLSAEQRLEERVALGLRCTAGIDLAALSRELGGDFLGAMEPRLRLAQAQGWIRWEEGRVQPQPHALALADAVARQLLGI